MGLLDVFRGKPRRTLIPVEVTKKKATRKRRTALEVAIDRRTMELQKENPALFDKIVLKKAGLVSDDEPDPLDKLFALEDRMDRRMKRRKDNDDDEQGGFSAIAKAFGEGLGRVAMAYVQQQQGIPANAPAQAQAPVPQLPPGHAPPPVSAGDPNVEQLIRDLVQMTPMEAADWLRGQNSPHAGQVINALVNTPDARIPELLPQIRAIAPRGALVLEGRM